MAQQEDKPTSEHTGKGEKRRFSFKRFFFRLLLLFLILSFAGIAAYNVFFDAKVENYLTQRVQQELEKQFQREVSVGHIAVNFPNPQVIISNLAIARHDSLEEGTLISAETLKATILLRTFLADRILFDDVVLDSPSVWIEFDEQGNSNLPSFGGVKQEEEEPEEPSWINDFLERLYFPDIQLIDGQVHFAHQQIPLSVTVNRVNTTLSFALQGPHVQGHISLENGEVEYQKQGVIPTTISGDIDFQGNSLTLSDFQGQAGNSDVTVNGAIQNVADPELDITLTATLALDEIDRYANVNQNLSGMAQFKGDIKGPVSDIRVQGHLESQQATAWKLALKNVQTDLLYQGQSLELEALSVNLFDGNVSGGVELSFADGFGYAADAALKDVNIEYVNSLIEQELEVAGLVSGDVTVQAESVDFQDLVLDSALTFQDIQTYGVALPQAKAEIHLEQETLTVNNLDADLFQGNATGNLTLKLFSDFQYQANLNVTQFKIEDIMALVPQPPDVSGQVDGTIHAEGSHFDLEHASVDAELQVTNLDAYDITSPQVDAAVRMSDHSLFINELSTQLFGGRVQGNGRLTLAGSRLPQFETALDLRDISVETIIQQFAPQTQEQGIGIQAGISGDVALRGDSFSLEDISGTVNLAGSGNIQVTIPDGDTTKESQVPLDVELEAAMDAGRVNIAALQVDSTSLDLTTTGTVNLAEPAKPDMQLDYRITSQDLQTLMKQVLAFVPGMEKDSPLFQFSGNIDRLQGTIQGPPSDIEVRADAVFSDTDIVWIKADRMQADVIYRGTVLEIPHFEASLQSARVQSDEGEIQLAGPRGVELNIPVHIKAGKVEDYLLMVKQDLPVTGELEQISTRIQGPADMLQAEIDVGVYDGRAWEQSFDSLTGTLEMIKNEIRFQPVKVKQNEGTITLTGFFGFDLAFQVEAAVSNLNIRDIDAAEHVASQYDGTMEMTLTADGTIDDPRANAAIRFTNLAYTGNPIEDVTCDIVVEEQTLKATLTTFREKFIANLQLALVPGLDYQAELLMEEAAIEQILSLAIELEGISGIISGRISSAGSLNELQGFSADVKLSTLDLTIFGQNISNENDIDLELTQQKLVVKSLEMKGEELGVFAKGFLDFQGNYDLDLDGIFDLRPVQTFLPESTGITSLSGKVQVICSVRGTFQEPIVEGLAEINQGSVQVDAYVDPVTDIKGKLAFSKGRIDILRVEGNVSKGTFTAGGHFTYSGITPQDFSIEVRGKNLVIKNPVPEYRPLELTASPRIRIEGDLTQQKLTGEIEIHKALYTQEIDILEMALTKTRTVALPTSEGAADVKPLLLDLYITAPKDIKIRNKLAEIDLSANLRIQGSTVNPKLEGRIGLLDGKVSFGGVRYEIISGVIDFVNPMELNPEMNIQVETTVQEYEINLGIEGNLEQFGLVMSSEPQLSDGEIARLLAAGSDEGSGGYNLVTKPLQSLVEDRIEKALKFDRFTVNVDPLLSSSGDSDATPTVTLGKRLFSDLLLTFTTSVGGSEQSQIVEVEYELSDNLSLTARRNEKGEIDTSFTFKFKIK